MSLTYPDDRTYHSGHLWAKEEADGIFLIGITDYAQDQLGELVFINLPEEGDSITAGEAFCDVESVKAVSDIFSGVTGKIAEVNGDLADNPQKVNEAPYDAWFVKVEDITSYGELMDAEEYKKYCAEL